MTIYVHTCVILATLYISHIFMFDTIIYSNTTGTRKAQVNFQVGRSFTFKFVVEKNVVDKSVNFKCIMILALYPTSYIL